MSMEEDNYAAYHKHTHTRWDAELLIRCKDALSSEKAGEKEKIKKVPNKKATVIPHSDLTLEWLHSIQPGREGLCVKEKHVCVQTHGET